MGKNLCGFFSLKNLMSFNCIAVEERCCCYHCLWSHAKSFGSQVSTFAFSVGFWEKGSIVFVLCDFNLAVMVPFSSLGCQLKEQRHLLHHCMVIRIMSFLFVVHWHLLLLHGYEYRKFYLFYDSFLSYSYCLKCIWSFYMLLL